MVIAKNSAKYRGLTYSKIAANLQQAFAIPRNPEYLAAYFCKMIRKKR